MTADPKSPLRIVVGYDGSPGSRVALDWAIDTAREAGGRLTIVHGVSMSAASYPAMDFALAEPVFERTARELVAEGADHARAHLDTEQIETQYWMGSPAGQIIEWSKDADLVVVGSRGRGRLLGGLLGSTSYAVAAHAHCPVVVVRGLTGDDPEEPPAPNRPGRDHRVIVGSDASEPSQRAVEAAAGAASRASAPLHIMRVVQPIVSSTWMLSDVPAADVMGADDVLKAAGAGLTGVAEQVHASYPELEVTTEAVLGDPGTTLAERGADAGLIVVGSRGRGGFTGMLLGSVSHRVIHDAVCPVMVVR